MRAPVRLGLRGSGSSFALSVAAPGRNGLNWRVAPLTFCNGADSRKRSPLTPPSKFVPFGTKNCVRLCGRGCVGVFEGELRQSEYCC